MRMLVQYTFLNFKLNSVKLSQIQIYTDPRSFIVYSTFYNFYTDIIAGECEDKQAGDAGMELAGTRT